VDVSRVRFIPPALATQRSSPPAGEHWQYEVKFDGFRIQLHKVGLAATLFGRNGGDLTRRIPTIAAAVLALPTGSRVIDGELIAAGAEGLPDFLALLHGSRVPVCVYGFDLMELDGRDLRDQPLEGDRRSSSDYSRAQRVICSDTVTTSQTPAHCSQNARASDSRESWSSVRLRHTGQARARAGLRGNHPSRLFRRRVRM
jgi:ATP-dependent DNA ligase